MSSKPQIAVGADVTASGTHITLVVPTDTGHMDVIYSEFHPMPPAQRQHDTGTQPMTQVLIDRELLERAASMELDTTARSIRIQDELRALLAQPSQQDETVEVRGWQWLDTGHYRKTLPKNAHNPRDWNPLMTVAQHERILAASVPAGCKVVKMELLELLHEMVDLHERRDTVLTVHMEQLRAILEAKNEQG